MPGVTDSSLTVTAIDPGVMILPTKTRPKKLHLRGSDGRRYRPGQSTEGLSETGLAECRRRTNTVADYRYFGAMDVCYDIGSLLRPEVSVRNMLVTLGHV